MQIKMDRAIRTILKDFEGIDKILQTRKLNDMENLKRFLSKEGE